MHQKQPAPKVACSAPAGGGSVDVGAVLPGLPFFLVPGRSSIPCAHMTNATPITMEMTDQVQNCRMVISHSWRYARSLTLVQLINDGRFFSPARTKPSVTNFLAVNLDIVRRVKSQAHLAILDRRHRDHHALADADAFSDFST